MSRALRLATVAMFMASIASLTMAFVGIIVFSFLKLLEDLGRGDLGIALARLLLIALSLAGLTFVIRSYSYQNQRNQGGRS